MPLSIQHTYRQSIASFLIALAPGLALVGCSSMPPPPSPPTAEAPPSRQASIPKTAPKNIPALPPAGSGRGGYYLDDGPGDDIPEGLLDMPDPEPQVEPYHKWANRPYVVFGKRYIPLTHDRPFRQRGKGSWYGKKFHGQKTASGELYDMYKMTAAHPTLPLPSYARVTNVANGKQVIVRVNDRGPFHSGRIIDLSYAAALKLGYLGKGSAELEVERLLPEEIARIASSRREQATGAEQATTVQSVSYAPTTDESVQRTTGSTLAPPDSAMPGSAGANAVPLAAPGYYIQFGAYSQADNAEAVRSRLMQKWEGRLPPLQVVESGALYRLHSGPFATRPEAAMAALALQNAGTAKPVIVQR
jgi:rare lipoprotein A